jgi:hypothetical protein
MNRTTCGKENGEWDNSSAGQILPSNSPTYKNVFNSETSWNYHEMKPQLALIHGINTPNSNSSFLIKLV